MDKTGKVKLISIVSLFLLFIIALLFGYYYWQSSSLIKKLKDEKNQCQTELAKADDAIKEFKEEIARMEAEEAAKTAAAGEDQEDTQEPSIIKECGYIKDLYVSKGKNYLKIDYVNFLTGEAATQAAREDGEIGPDEVAPDDIYIRNRSTRLRTFEIADNVQVSIKGHHVGKPVLEDHAISYADFKSMYENDDPASSLSNLLYWITIQDGIVVNIAEQYHP